MHLRCKVCGETQPVNTADYEDEDPRTQGIRRTFRAAHIASCGEGAVSLVLQTVEATWVDPELWTRYLDAVEPPPDVTVNAEGYFLRGSSRVCEDCWQTIPRYVDYPDGLTSPESDGAGGAVPKCRPSTVDTESPERSAAAQHLAKVVCVPCYLAAFARVYPEAPAPTMSVDVIGMVAA